jgi:hypothetical protein
MNFKGACTHLETLGHISAGERGMMLPIPEFHISPSISLGLSSSSQESDAHLSFSCSRFLSSCTVAPSSKDALFRSTLSVLKSCVAGPRSQTGPEAFLVQTCLTHRAPSSCNSIFWYTEARQFSLRRRVSSLPCMSKSVRRHTRSTAVLTTETS